MLPKPFLLVCSLAVLLCPLHLAAQPDLTELDRTRAVSFSGGGWSTHTASAGWLSGLVAAGQQGLVPASSLHSIFAQQDILGGNSGGSWFLTMLAYSPAFVASLDAAPDVDDWFGRQGYMGSQITKFEQLSRVARANLTQLLQAYCPSYVSSSSCQELSSVLADLIFAYQDGMWAPGLIFLASLWDGDFNQGPTWKQAVEIVFDYDSLLSDFRHTNFQHLAYTRAPSLDDQDIVVAGAMGTSIEVLNAAGSDSFFATNNLSVKPGSAAQLAVGQPPIEGPIPIVFVDPGTVVSPTSPLVANFLPSGPKALVYRSDMTGMELSVDLPAEVDLSNVSIFDVAMVSSAAAAGMASESMVFEIFEQLVRRALAQMNSPPEGVDSQQLGATLFAGLSNFMKRAAIGATVDQANRLTIGDIDPLADIVDLSDQRALRLYDGGYVDNLAAAYVLKQIQAAHNPDDFTLTLFVNTGGMGDAESTAALLEQIGDERSAVLPLPSDLLNLFGRPDYRHPGTTALLSMFGVDISTSSPAVFDAHAWKNAAPSWVYQPHEAFRLSYYRIEVETINNPHFQIHGGHQGVLHLFINQDANTSAAPFTREIAENYCTLFANTRQAVLEQGYQYLAEALNLERETLGAPPVLPPPVSCTQQLQRLYRLYEIYVRHYGYPGGGLAGFGYSPGGGYAFSLLVQSLYYQLALCFGE